ncbi:MAG: hypothetical protein M0R06_17305 [Sphaerochaeta sp.]|nr:hypothetical protein [Sphaerochaeta sp.]
MRLSYCLYGMDPTNPVEDPKKGPEKTPAVGLGGLFQWAEAFNRAGGHGVIFPLLTPELIDTFDIIHVNWTPHNQNYILSLRENIKGDTKLIANVDYTISAWSGVDPYVLKASLDQCDMVFHVEPFGAARLSDFLGRKVHVLPHPVDVHGIKRLGVAKPTMDPVTLSFQYHRYKDTWDPYFYAMRPLRDEYGIRTALCNAGGGPKHGVAIESLFDLIYHRCDYIEYLELLSQMYLNVDVPPDITYGRGIIDAAAIGLPTVGYARTLAANIIYPELVVRDCYDTLEIREKVRTLLDDPDLAATLAVEGSKRCEYFSLTSSLDRMVAALESEGLV